MLGPEGWCALIDDTIHREPGLRVQAVDTVGAGDCFVGALAARLADGASIIDALHYANIAAAFVVERPEEAIAMPHHAEVVTRMTMGGNTLAV